MRVYSGVNTTFKERTELVDALQQQDRDRLLEIALPLYRLTQQQQQVTHFYFTAPDRTNIVRLHQPDRFGDILQRPSMLQVVATGRPAWGLEIGPLGTFTLRTVHPVTHPMQGVVGYIELGMEIEHLLQPLSSELDVELMVTVDKSTLQRPVWEQGMKRLGRSATWEAFADRVVIYSNLPSPSDKIRQHVERQNQATPHAHHHPFFYKESFQHLYVNTPLLSMDGKSVGTLTALANHKSEGSFIWQQIVNTLLASVMLLLLYSLFLFFYLRRLDMRLMAEQREADKLLYEHRQRLIEAQHLGQIGNWELDLADDKLHWSEEIFHIFDLSPSEFTPSYDYFLSLVHPEDRELLDNRYTESVQNGTPYHFEHRMLLDNGARTIWVEERGETLYDSAGTPIRSRGTVQDITSKKEADLELERTIHTKDEFLAAMSHELRTPLTAIVGNSELLADQIEQPEQLELIHSIELAGRTQLSLVNDILDMSRLQAGAFDIEDTPYNLALLVNSLKQLVSAQAIDAGLELIVTLNDPPPVELLGDSQRITQILLNLLGNSIKFTDAGEVRLTVWNDDRNLFFRVSDSGIGMSPETMDRLFTRFTQADGSISRRFGGSGLGLYISDSLADLMGGLIDASSQEGRGSVFTLILPYQPTTHPTAILSQEDVGQRVDSSDEPPLSGHVLIAEDTSALQLLERRIIERMGLTVTTVADGRQAIERVEQGDIDLVLMDMQMPDIDGIEATRILRERGYDLPIIALTANVMERHQEEFRRAGCTAFHAKPIDRELLQSQIGSLLSK